MVPEPVLVVWFRSSRNHGWSSSPCGEEFVNSYGGPANA